MVYEEEGINMMESFLFVTPEVTVLDLTHFRESTIGKFAKIWVTLIELDKVSVNGRIYRFEEAGRIARSMVGRPIYYDIDWTGKHIQNKPPIGEIEKTKVIGRKIKGIVKIICPKIIEKIKQGMKFLFSVGGIAITQKFTGKVTEAGKKIRRLIGTIVQHAQMIPFGTGKNILGQSKVGFPSAKMEKVLEIQESTLVVEPHVYFKDCESVEKACKIMIAPTMETIVDEDEEIIQEIIDEDIVEESSLD